MRNPLEERIDRRFGEVCTAMGDGALNLAELLERFIPAAHEEDDFSEELLYDLKQGLIEMLQCLADYDVLEPLYVLMRSVEAPGD